MDTLAGVSFVILAAALTAFQIGLALGAPWGSAAYGGQNPGVLPRRLRIASGLAGFGLYPFIALFVADAAGLIDTGLADTDRSSTWLWVLAGFFALGTIMNLASRSRIERLWAPVSLVMAACCAVLAT